MRVLLSMFVFGTVIFWGGTGAADFRGWQSLYVVQQEGMPRLLYACDLNADGRQELIVVNSRSSRLDLYCWRSKESRPEPEPSDKNQPNELPMAPTIAHTEVQLENIPKGVVVQDLDGDNKPELVVLVAPPNQVQVYCCGESGEWDRQYKLDLLEGEISSTGEPLLLRRRGAQPPLLYINLNEGIQQLSLERGGRAEWLAPRERKGRVAWWLTDLDGDGNEDIVEQTRASNEAIRWYRGLPDGKVAPAAVLLDRSVNDAQILRHESTDLALLDGSVGELLRRYRLAAGASSRFGRRYPLAVEDGTKAVWCGMVQGEKRALVVADRNRPRLLSYVLSDKGWGEETAFPAVSKINAITSPSAEPGTLLIWADETADLMKSRWESGRLTYPAPVTRSEQVVTRSEQVEAREIVALATVNSTTWWAQKVDSHVDLYRWESGEIPSEPLRFEDVGSKVDEVLWIGGNRLLVKEAHARGLKLAVQREGATVVTSPTLLEKASLDEFRLFAIGDTFRLGRLVEGVLQWMADDLHSYEQVMLSQGQELGDYIAVDERHGWALQKSGPFIHRIEIDASGLSRAAERIKVSQGNGLVADPTLGILLVGHDRLTHLSEGEPHDLHLIDAVDDRIGRPWGVRKTRFHRLGVTDIDGDGQDDLLVFDDLDHRITVLADQKGSLSPKIAWPVFEDKNYPYGDNFESMVHEPRAVRGLDLDGDGRQDLALLCHDRLLIYIAHETE